MKKTLTVCALLFSGVLAIADHLPAKLQANGKPEDTLAGINLERDNPAKVLQSLGPPTKKVTAPNNPQWTGYLWDMPGLRIEVEISRGNGKEYLGAVSIVRLDGGEETLPSPPNLPASRQTTGRGVKLGDTLDRLKSVYDSRLQMSKQEPVPVTTNPFLAVPGSETAVVQWTPNEFTLTAGFDGHGRIIALRLRPPECYPGGCQ